MRLNEIIDLQEISPDNWRAKYQGNYGIYTIHITFDRQGELSDYSCSCPSNYFPCKHIYFVEEEIKNRIAENQNSIGKNKLKIEDVLKQLSLQELRDFVVRQAKNNPNLTNTISLTSRPLRLT